MEKLSGKERRVVEIIRIFRQFNHENKQYVLSKSIVSGMGDVHSLPDHTDSCKIRRGRQFETASVVASVGV